MLKKQISEFFGTAILVFVGCGSVVFAGEQIGLVGISFAFGFAVLAAIYICGPISGCHINPSVTIAAVAAGRMPVSHLAPYVIAQVGGAVFAAALIYTVAIGRGAGFDPAVAGMGQNGFGPGYLGGYDMVGAVVFEVVATFFFVGLILAVTNPKTSPGPLAGVIISLALVGIVLIGVPITGVSLNAARSIGPAVFVGGDALTQLWLFLVAPAIGAVAAGLAFRPGGLLSVEDKAAAEPETQAA